MDFLLGILIAISGILLVLGIRSLTTLVHEMGHAIPALLFTKETVKVYIGTYGDISKGLNILIGRFQIFFYFNPFDWKIGMCTHKGTDRFWHNVLIIIGGPIASLFISIPLINRFMSGSMTNEVKFISMVIIVASMIDFLVNIIPSSRQIYMHDGTVGYNDGLQLQMLLARKNLTEEHLVLESLVKEEKHGEVMALCSKHIAEDGNDPLIHRLMIDTLIKQQDHDKALDAYRRYEQLFGLSDSDKFELGKLLIQLDRHNQALPFFEDCMERSFQDPNLLYHIALVKKEQGNFHEAIKRLNGAIYYGMETVDTFLLRGQVNMRLGNHEDAYEDLKTAHQLEEDHPALIYNIGKWHLIQGDKEHARDCYLNAKELGFEKITLEREIEELS